MSRKRSRKMSPKKIQNQSGVLSGKGGQEMSGNKPKP